MREGSPKFYHNVLTTLINLVKDDQNDSKLGHIIYMYIYLLFFIIIISINPKNHIYNVTPFKVILVIEPLELSLF